MAAATAAFTENDMSKIRIRLLFNNPFWGSLALNLKIEIDRSIPTLATDGTRLIVNPDFMASLIAEEQDAVTAHEILHPALLHIYRRGDRDMRLWNMACDYAINPMLIEAGFKLPMSWRDPATGRECKPLLDNKYKGMAAEQIYALLQQEEAQEGGKGPKGGRGSKGAGGSEPDPSPTGTFSDGATDAGGSDADGTGEGGGAADRPMTARDWEMAAEQAVVVGGKQAGSIPGALLEQIRASHEAKIDWRAVLSQFVTNTVVSDVAWSRPNRRYVGRGMYLPGPMKENTGEMVIGVDTSGSVSTQMLTEFAAELTGILHSARPEKVHVVYCDTRVNGTTEFTPDDAEITLECKGRGGTAFKPVFKWVETQGVEPVCMVYLTDLESSDTPTEPAYPVLWVTPESTTLKGPFGATIRIPAK